MSGISSSQHALMKAEEICLATMLDSSTTTTTTGGENVVLFDMERQRKPEYWQFIKLVAPEPDLPVGQKQWTTDDAKQSFCLKCQKSFPFVKGSSKDVKRHMLRHHQQDLLAFLDHSYQQPVHNRKRKYSEEEEERSTRQLVLEEMDGKHKKMLTFVSQLQEEVQVFRQQIQQDLYQMREQVNLLTSTIIATASNLAHRNTESMPKDV